MTPTDRLAHALPKDPAKDSPEQAEIRAALATVDQPGPAKTLVLHIAVDGFNADDLDHLADIWADGEPGDRARERLHVVTEEWVRPDVGLTLVTIPGDKCMNDDFDVAAFNGRIVGAETRDREKA